MIDQAAQRGAELTQHLLAFSRKQPLLARDTNVNSLITEATKLQFRAEAFNFTNTPLFGMPGSVISGYDSNGAPTNAGNFGRITTTNAFYTPRDIQFALKLIF